VLREMIHSRDPKINVLARVYFQQHYPDEALKEGVFYPRWQIAADPLLRSLFGTNLFTPPQLNDFSASHFKF
jgi:hypothetical protein